MHIVFVANSLLFELVTHFHELKLALTHNLSPIIIEIDATQAIDHLRAPTT